VTKERELIELSNLKETPLSIEKEQS
jgi:hypothetical protein